MQLIKFGLLILIASGIFFLTREKVSIRKEKTNEIEKTIEATPSEQQINAEFVRELFKTVLVRDLKDTEEFLRYLNVLDQGGHYEGVYNGIVYSTEYKDKEKGSTAVAAIKAYAEFLSFLLENQRSPKEIENEVLTQSLFTLKRKLGEEVLKAVDLKKDYKEKLASWYGKFTILLSSRGIDFGLPQRNRPEEYYHYKWALSASEDRIKWELLNRAHTVLNVLGGIIVPSKTTLPVRGAQLHGTWEVFRIDQNSKVIFLSDFSDKSKKRAAFLATTDGPFLKKLFVEPFADTILPYENQSAFEAIADEACIFTAKNSGSIPSIEAERLRNIFISELSSPNYPEREFRLKNLVEKPFLFLEGLELQASVVNSTSLIAKGGAVFCNDPEGKRYFYAEQRTAFTRALIALHLFKEAIHNWQINKQKQASDLRSKEFARAQSMKSTFLALLRIKRQLFVNLTWLEPRSEKTVIELLKVSLKEIEASVLNISKQYSELYKKYPEIYSPLPADDSNLESIPWTELWKN